MSRQEQNDRHIIWSDISLDLDDWRESLEELYPGYSDDELYDIMVKSNAENLYDERVNLDIQLSQPIIVIGDLGRWNGRVAGYKMIDSGNIRALTKPEQELFLDYLKNSPTSKYWYPVFAVMIGTGLRVGEVTGLRWCDIDLEEGIIDVNHTLVYYDHRTEGSKRGCYFNVNTTKTPAGRRKVPMLGFVKEAFLMEKERQELLDLHCEATVDGYTDFIFINRFGQPQHQATLNKVIRRIIRDCNDEQLLKDENAEVLLPHFSCHSLRHTFTTRMCEAGVNVKVIQDTLGHKDISTTLNIYTDVTKELRKSEFEGLDSYFKNEYNKVSV